MKIVTMIARILLGLWFFVFGLNGFFHFIPAPPQTGVTATFMGVVLALPYGALVFGIEIIAGALLLTKQFVPFAIVMLAAVFANILTFHITMEPSGLPLALVALILWFIVAFPLRGHFAPLFTRTLD